MNRSMTFAISLLAAGLISGSVLAENVAIIGGRVVTGGPEGTIENGTVLIVDGKISAVGAGLAAPEGYRVIEAGGRYVTTGLMLPYSSLGVQEINLEKSTVDHIVNSPSPFFKPASKVPFSAAFDISYAINPKATPIPVTRIEGIPGRCGAGRARQDLCRSGPDHRARGGPGGRPTAKAQQEKRRWGGVR